MTAVRLAALLALLLVTSRIVEAQTTTRAPRDTSALRFRGFRAGAPLAELDAVVRRAGGAGLRCELAARDRRVAECRAALIDSAVGPVRIWVSAMDSVAGVIALNVALDSAALAGWRGELERRYGRVPVRAQNSQRMMQWVRRGRMLRLTWRTERGELAVSVSLVDGRVLDAWGAKPAPSSQ